jgi:hypothetical protein
MIVGFKIRMTSAEIHDHCRERASYHRRRADEKAAEVPKIRESMERLKAQGLAPAQLTHMTKSNYRSDDPAADLEADVREHRNKALVFDFFAGHLFDEDYTLERDDLVRLEILKS